MGGRDQSARFVRRPDGPPQAEALGGEAANAARSFIGAADTANCRAKRAGKPTASKIASGALAMETD